MLSKVEYNDQEDFRKLLCCLDISFDIFGKLVICVSF